jgi:predicted permease
MGDPFNSRDSQSYFTKARLRPGASLEQANVALSGVASHLREAYPETWDETRRFIPVPSEDVIVNPLVDRYLVPAATAALALVAVVLLIACANLASFLLARGMDRKKEIAMRLALGARRGSLVRQLLTETTLLALLGGLLGLVLSTWILRVLSTMELPLPGGVHPALEMNRAVLLYGLALSLATGLLFGLVPALHTSRPDLASTLKDASGGGPRPRRFGLRNVLVSGQVAASLVLLIGSGLFVRSLRASQGVDPGFGHEPTAVLSMVVSGERYGPEEGRIFVRSLLDRLGSIPGVEAAGLTENLHLSTTTINTLEVQVDGVEPPPGRRFHEIDQARVDGGFFAAAGIAILAGRNFQERDVPGGPAVVIVNEVMAERFWPGQDPIGKRIRHRDGTEMEVVGVSRSTKVRNIGEGPRPFVYRPYSQNYDAFLTVLVRTSRGAEEAVSDGLRTLREMDPEMVVVEAKTMDRHLGAQILPRRIGAAVSAILASLALLLASIGLYGIVSYAVARRSREMGIRMSLGAEPGRVVREMLWEGMSLVVVGGGVGLVLAAAAAQLLGNLLFGIRPMDPLTFVAIPTILLAVTLLAAYLPARRASRVDPVTALKAE